MAPTNTATPLALYLHHGKQEWRARYLDNGIKKAKHFSCRRFNAKRAFFLASLFLRKMQDTSEFPSESFFNFWLDACSAVTCLNDAIECRHAKDHNKNSSPIIDKSHPNYHQNQLTLFRVLDDIRERRLVSPPSIPWVPKLCLDYIKQHYIKLDSGTMQRNARQLAFTSMSTIYKQLACDDFEEFNLGQRINLKRVIENILDKGQRELKANPFYNENTSHECKLVDSIFKLRKLNNRPLSSYSRFKHADVDLNGQNWGNILQNFRTLTDSYTNTIKQMCKDAEIDYNLEWTHAPCSEFPIDSFNAKTMAKASPKTGCAINSSITSDSTDLTRNNSLYDVGNIGAILRASVTRDTLLLAQATRSRSDFDLIDEQESYEEVQAAQREKLLNKNLQGKVCNDKLKSLIEQASDYPKLDAFTDAVYNCLDEESRATSDLESLIQISSRSNGNGANKDKDAASASGGDTKSSKSSNAVSKLVVSGTSLHGVKRGTAMDIIPVSYIDDKVVPTMAMDFKIEPKIKTTSMVLAGKERLDVNLDELSRALSRTNTGQMMQTLEAILFLDQRIESVATICSRMHRALYRYHKLRLGLNPPPMEREAPLFSSESDCDLPPPIGYSCGANAASTSGNTASSGGSTGTNKSKQDQSSKSAKPNTSKNDSNIRNVPSPGGGKNQDTWEKYPMTKTSKNNKPIIAAMSSSSVNDLEELLNLETLHLICETLFETKQRILEQAQREIAHNLEILHSVMPAKCYKVLANVLYGGKNLY